MRRVWACPPGAVALLVLCMTASYAAVPAEPMDDVARAAPATRGDRPRDFLEFSERLTADCMLHRARLRQIANTHPSRAIRVVLVSYTGTTRSQGDSELVLAPEAEPQPLGCDGTSGLKRRWEILDSAFVSAEPVTSE